MPRTNQFPFRYLELGEPHLPHLLFLHGYSNSSQMFLPLMRRLQHHYHCLSLDLPTILKPHSSYSIHHLSNYITRFIHTLQLTPLSLAGFSFSGPIAIDVASQIPSLIKHLYLLNSSPRIIAGPLKQKLLHKLHPLASSRSIYSLYKTLNRSPLSRRLLPAPTPTHTATSALLQTTAHILSLDLTHTFHQLSVPKTVVLFKDDIFVRWRKQTRLLNRLDCQVITFDHGGHAHTPEYWNQIHSLFQPHPATMAL